MKISFGAINKPTIISLKRVDCALSESKKNLLDLDHLDLDHLDRAASPPQWRIYQLTVIRLRGRADSRPMIWVSKPSSNEVTHWQIRQSSQ